MARLLPLPSSDLDDDEIVPDSELEFADLDGAVVNESSDGSGDDFVPEESSESDVPRDQEPEAPLWVSMATPSTSTRPSPLKLGSSFKTSRGRKSAAGTQSGVESSGPCDSDDSVVVSKKPRGKKAAPARHKGRKDASPIPRPPVPRRVRGRRGEPDQESDMSDGLLEPSDDDAKPPPKGLQPHQTRALIKVAERRMRKKLGRKLTIVRLDCLFQTVLH